MITARRAIPVAAAFWILLILSLRLHGFKITSQRQMTLRDRLSDAFPYNHSAELPKIIWQTWKYSPTQEEFDFGLAESSWSAINPDFRHVTVTDDEATSLIAESYADVGEVQKAYESLPEPVLKADFFRYLILLARGGVYSDIDTTALKPASDWVPSAMDSFGMVIGIEADPDRSDWHMWYARRIQFCQWTIMGKQGHPILVDIVASITEETLARKELGQLNEESMKTVMEFTGPGVWTDVVFDFFNDSRFFANTDTGPRNVTWEHFANLGEPMKEGDVVVLPITSFSPGVGHMGSGSPSDPIAYVSHGFSGTWKHDER